MDDKQKIKFIMLIARALHRYGASADRIETALYTLSDKLKIEADYFSLPTSIMANFKSSNEDEFTRMIRLDPGKINLEKLYLADKTVDDVVDENITLLEGIENVQTIIDKKPFHADWLTNIALIILAMGVAIILGGSLKDSLLSGVFGLIIALFNSEIKIERIDTVREAFLSFIVGFGAFLAASLVDGLNPHLIVLSTLIYFVPGLSLTMAIGEIASQNLTSGTARLMGAIIILMKICFGAYLGSVVCQNYFSPIASTPNPFDIIYRIPALILVSFSFVISFQARWKDSPWILFAGITTFSLHYGLNYVYGNIAAALLAGVYIGAGSNLYARLAKKPAMIVSLPAIILLVPGSVGFKGLEFLFGNDAISGVNTLFNTFILGIALVAGTYFGNIFIRPKRSL